MTESNDRIALKPFSVGPLRTDGELSNYRRLPDDVQALVNEIVNSLGGCLLVTGYRGVGKTSFVNKVLFDAAKLFSEKRERKKGRKVLVPVKLSLARGYSTDKLLRRLIRKLFYSINECGVYDHLSPDVQRRLEIAFLRTSRQIKTALSQGLKRIITHAETETTSRSRGYSLAPSVGFDGITASIASLSRQDVREKTVQETTSQEMARERGLELEFLEYDDEIAESDLCELIDLLSVCQAQYYRKGRSKVIKSPEFLWRRLPAKIQIGKRAIRNYRYVTKQRPDPRGVKLVFVLDEIDKMTIEEAESIFRSLKNLFLKGNVTFILVSGKEFYYQWLMKRTTEDDVLFSLFTRIIHVALFEDNELETLGGSLVEDASQFPSDLLTHLIHKAKGTPREFLRELLRFTQWHESGPFIDISTMDQRIIGISKQLHPYIHRIYEPIAKDTRVDPGIRDHIRRSLHNWIEWMTILVTFDKRSLMRSQVEGTPSSNEILLSAKVRPNLERLFELLVQDHIIEETGQIEERIIYTFASQIKADLEAIDSSVALDLQSELAAREKELRRLLIEVQGAIGNGNYESALATVHAAEQIELASKELQQLGTVLRKTKSEIENVLEARQLVSRGDEQYANGQYAQAYETYHSAQALGVDLTTTIQVSTVERDEREKLIELREILTARFDEEELRTLCFDLDVDYDSLPGEAKSGKARELIVHLQRRERIPDLGKMLRPDIEWDSLHQVAEEALLGLHDKLLLTRLQIALASVRDAQTNADREGALRTLSKAIFESEGSESAAVTGLRRRAVDERERLVRAEELNEEIRKLLDEEPTRAVQMFEELKEIAPEWRQTKRLEEHVAAVGQGYELLDQAKALLSAGQVLEASALLDRIRSSSSLRLESGAEILREQVHSITTLLRDGQYEMRMDSEQALRDILARIDRVKSELASIPPQIEELEARTRAALMARQMANEIRRFAQEGDWDNAWDTLEELKQLAQTEEMSRLYRQEYKWLTRQTLDKAEAETQRKTSATPARIARILGPLLNHDQDNATARALLESMK